ncbi:MAG: flagellar basal body protein [Candidatus Gastranaerophilales bacterium]|nr:flagellar basal body protein [Candidatus Gastranaerophilales bacterium]
MYTPSDSFGKINLMLDLVAQRQRALSANLANMDTPGYVRKDIKFDSYLGTMNSPLETELSSKLGPSAIIEDRQQGPINAANELTEMQKNSLMYYVASRNMTSLITNMKTVMNVGK